MSAHRTAEVSSETDGILLSLPQSDLPTKTKNQGIGAATATKVADLVLFQLPPSVEFQNDFYGGNCQIVANNQSASLVSPTTSFKLVTVGTSNTLVVWKDEKERKKDGERTNDADEDSSTASPPPTKRSKPTAPVTSCRLIQPGGSGASFLIGQPHTIDPADLFQWFEQRRRQYSNAAGMVSTSTLSNLFQTSTMEIQTVLSKLPNIVAIQQSEVEQYWQLVPDEEVLLGQRALTEYVLEENMLQDNNGNAFLRMDDVTNGISERLLQLLWDQDAKDIEQLGSNEDRSMAIARKTAFLAQTDPSRRKFDARLVYLDPHKIAFYVLRDLFLRYPSYAMSDLLQKWEARLPMSETFEKCLTVEWLQEQRLVPDQLVLEDVDNASGITSSTSSSSLGKVIRLASSDTVLAWKES